MQSGRVVKARGMPQAMFAKLLQTGPPQQAPPLPPPPKENQDIKTGCTYCGSVRIAMAPRVNDMQCPTCRVSGYLTNGSREWIYERHEETLRKGSGIQRKALPPGTAPPPPINTSQERSPQVKGAPDEWRSAATPKGSGYYGGASSSAVSPSTLLPHE